MPRYLVLLYSPEGDEATERQRWAQLPLWQELTDGLRDSGLLVANGALHRADTATTVRVRDDEIEMTDGPFAITKEVLAGFYVLDCHGLDGGAAARRAVPDRPVRLGGSPSDYGPAGDDPLG